MEAVNEGLGEGSDAACRVRIRPGNVVWPKPLRLGGGRLGGPGEGDMAGDIAQLPGFPSHTVKSIFIQGPTAGTV